MVAIMLTIYPQRDFAAASSAWEDAVNEVLKKDSIKISATLHKGTRITAGVIQKESIGEPCIIIQGISGPHDDSEEFKFAVQKAAALTIKRMALPSADIAFAMVEHSQVTNGTDSRIT